MEVKIFWICVCLLVLTDRPPPIILQGPINQTLAVDGTALLKCKATGEPLPVISWLKEGFTFLGRDPRATIQDQGTLQIKNLRVRSIWVVVESILSTVFL
jgi:roundabout axon guidance receptor 2